MLGGKCSLCNGKLDSRKICKECGLDNSKSEKYYKINRSSCDDLPLTHVHEDEWQEVKSIKKKSAPPKMAKYAYQTSESKKTQSKRAEADDTKKKGVLSIVAVLVALVPSILGILGTFTDSYESEPDYSMEAIYDPYEYVEAELPEFGDICSYELESGQYVVGVHIAEGYYEATLFDESDSIEVTDNWNGIYLYQSMFDESDDYLDDLRLFDGAIVTVTSQDAILLDTENGQTGEMPALSENFVTDRYRMYSYDEAEAGIDFEPGIYDLYTDADYCYLELTIYDEYGSQWDYRSFDLGIEGVHGSYFRNVVIPEGAVISCEDAGVELVPSEWIWTTDYMEHYY